MDYYFINDNDAADRWFFDRVPYCLDIQEIEEIARKIGIGAHQIAADFHKANEAELHRYGTKEGF